MNTIRIDPRPAVEWKLARHITSPTQQGSCLGLPRQYAPPPDDLSELEPTHYRGVKRRFVADRVKYEVWCWHNDKHQYVGVRDSAVEAARLYDAYCRAWGIEKPLNFEAEEGENI